MCLELNELDKFLPFKLIEHFFFTVVVHSLQCTYGFHYNSLMHNNPLKKYEINSYQGHLIIIKPNEWLSSLRLRK